ncbi:unnamed protein product [Ranitomeya imitator]|uniref:Uncharacterized protein n=1 Tax=Ranitomeya imitator TaxID=111125 RepID=A0ABN9LXB8_9NEOB|nr:unnamed protein product [Ranitomeya imitator]
MDRRSLAQDLRRWAVQEMGLPPHKAPSEEMLQRLFIGQCADIWKYVIRHVRSERTVRNMEGNLRWYQQMQHLEAQRSAEEKEQWRRKQLSQEILALRSELQLLQEQIQSAEKDVSRQELSNHKSQDINQRLMLLRAYTRSKEMECDGVRDETHNVQQSCVRLVDMGRVSRWDLVFPPPEEGPTFNTFPEPQILTDVREACQTRIKYLRSLYHDYSGSMPAGGDEMRSFNQSALDESDGEDLVFVPPEPRGLVSEALGLKERLGPEAAAGVGGHGPSIHVQQLLRDGVRP